jgi:hypothetical protein
VRRAQVDMFSKVAPADVRALTGANGTDLSKHRSVALQSR